MGRSRGGEDLTERAMSLVRRVDASREDAENNVLSKYMHPAQRGHAGASTWLFPTESFVQVLVDAREYLLDKEARIRRPNPSSRGMARP